MTALPPLESAVSEQLARIGRADVLVGIPSFNNERTIGHVVRAVVAGLAKHFPGVRAVLVNSDGGSTDRTREIVERTETGSLEEILVDAAPAAADRLVALYEGVPGKGSALRTIFRIAAELQASACCVVDSDLRSITPEWVQLLLAPVLKFGYEFVSPLYSRHRYDGTITNTIVYPLTRALYGKRIRQPIGGDFGFSGALASRFLDYERWEGPVARYGIDIFMTTTALAEGRRFCQAFLGAKLHDPKDPGADLQPMMVEVVSTLFELMERHEKSWAEVSGSEEVPRFGFSYAVGLDPVPVKMDRLTTIFRQASHDLSPVWEGFLSPGSLDAVREAAAASEPSFSDEAWTRILFEAAAGWRARRLPGETLIRSLVPLYLGKVASFVSETREGTDEQAEERLGALAAVFERDKDVLRELWRAGAR
ncbi:MAG TPA: glycosyl transferase family 2 [Thermoanaerobaculia bacterium]|nr:glycosyl transferase family 2 [Thermoanaerobaculia bacterium]